MRKPGIEPGAQRWQRWILPLNHLRLLGKAPRRGIEPRSTTRQAVILATKLSRMFSDWLKSYVHISPKVNIQIILRLICI
jgi:hypothetical protein